MVFVVSAGVEDEPVSSNVPKGGSVTFYNSNIAEARSSSGANILLLFYAPDLSLVSDFTSLCSP